MEKEIKCQLSFKKSQEVILNIYQKEDQNWTRKYSNVCQKITFKNVTFFPLLFSTETQ